LLHESNICLLEVCLAAVTVSSISDGQVNLLVHQLVRGISETK
jgi:hypothetical protein